MMEPMSKQRRKQLQAKLEKLYGYRSYSDDDVEVRESGAAGMGVFAKRQFLPGEIVLEVDGQLLRQKDYNASSYVMELNSKWYLEPSIPGAFVNHSCSPNIELVEMTKFSLGFVALVNIEPDSELVFDYQWPALDWTPRCHCGSLNCRGWVVAQDQVKKMKKIEKRRSKKKNKKKA